MKVVGLVSGGKDSCYNLMKCVADGHTVECLANLHPVEEVTHEIDSYMYQTVGHEALAVYSEAWQLPMYRRGITGKPVNMDMDYNQAVVDDEVEDLYELLREIKHKHPDIKGVSAGAIWSDYQYRRVANICQRLDLQPLCYLWQRDQAELLADMIKDGVKAIIIKVAAMGLNPKKHLGMTLAEIEPEMTRLQKEFGLNNCGEGGEFESFVLDCPLFKRRIVIDQSEVVLHSDDAFAPVAYLTLNKLHLEDKS